MVLLRQILKSTDTAEGQMPYKKYQQPSLLVSLEIRTNVFKELLVSSKVELWQAEQMRNVSIFNSKML